MGPRTLYQVLAATAREHGARTALQQPTGAVRGEYRAWTFAEYLTAAEEIAAGLRGLGIGKGDVVALNSETRAEFYLADLGILTNGSIAAALYPSYPPADLVRNLRNCGARAAFVEEPKMLPALRESGVERWILLTGAAEGAIALDDLRAQGRRALEKDPALLDRIRAEYGPADAAVLYLTSGATGEPKMALVTHAAIASNLEMAPAVLTLGPEDRTIAFLPSAHIAQRMVIEYLPMRCGVPVTFSESLLKLPQEIKAVKPTLLLAPPRMWERIYSTICAELKKRPAAAQKAFHAAVALGLAAARYRRAGKSTPPHIAWPLRLADRLMFTKIRTRFGGEIRVAVSGAAPLSKDLAEFYEAVGMPLIEGYGLTEGGVAALNPIGAPRPGSIGKALPGVAFRIAEDGEILISSPCLFAGYLNDPATTAEVLRDGWLHTGDLGYVDAEGFIYITGRKKELIVSSTGKKVFPSRIENLFKTEPLISHVLLVGDRLPYVTALITVNPAVAATLKGMDARNGGGGSLAEAEPVRQEVQRIVAGLNRQLAQFEQIRKYRILDRDFSLEHGELTATMKIRRARVMKNFSDQIEQLYETREP